MKINVSKLLLTVACMIALTACNLDQYNNSDPKKIKDTREGDVYVYGVKGDSARQLKNDYPSSPENDKRAKAIREKFFGGTTGANLQDGATTPAPADSTKKDGAKAEEPKK
jgi:hypothetical protein